MNNSKQSILQLIVLDAQATIESVTVFVFFITAHQSEQLKGYLKLLKYVSPPAVASSSIVKWKCFCFSQHLSVTELLKTKLIAINWLRYPRNNRKCHIFCFLQRCSSKRATRRTFEALKICLSASSGFFLNCQLKMLFFVCFSQHLSARNKAYWTQFFKPMLQRKMSNCFVFITFARQSEQLKTNVQSFEISDCKRWLFPQLSSEGVVFLFS